jgi:hypothetical protein
MTVNTFTITSIPFYDQYNKCYKNILSVNAVPSGPLGKFVSQINFPMLSPYQQQLNNNSCYNIPRCGLVLNNFLYNNGYNNCGHNSCYMTPNEIPNLTTYLLSNGYQIETQLTNMFNNSNVKFANSKIVLTATYYGNDQPNITYMR